MEKCLKFRQKRNYLIVKKEEDKNKTDEVATKLINVEEVNRRNFVDPLEN